MLKGFQPLQTMVKWQYISNKQDLLRGCFAEVLYFHFLSIAFAEQVGNLSGNCWAVDVPDNLRNAGGLVY